MLVLERKDDESIIIQNGEDSIEIKFIKDKNKSRYKLCINAPQKLEIFRKELLDKE